MQIGSRVYFDLKTGNVIEITNEREGDVVETTVEQDVAAYKSLSVRNRETFDFIQLEFGQYKRDFLESSGYRVNTETRTLEFNYPDPNEVEPSEPIYQEPLSVEVKLLKAKNQVLSEQVDFHEELIIELAMQIYE